MRIFLCTCLFFIGLNLNAQIKYNQHNEYLSNSEILWLNSKKIDFLSAPITDAKLISSVNNALKYRSLERKATAQSAAWGAAGLLSLTYNVSFFTLDNSGSFREDAIASIIGVFGAVATGLSIKYYIKKRKMKSIKKEHIEMSQWLSSG